MRRFGIGQPMRRLEDQRFITGSGRYTDDIVLEGQLHGVTVRAPVAHADITALDAAEARAAQGVRLVLTAEDLSGLCAGTIPCLGAVDGTVKKGRPVLAADRVRHVGEPVAFVVAESEAAARDAAELLEIDYEPIDAVADVVAASEERAPQLHEDATGNRAFEWSAGDAEATSRAFEKAAHVARVSVRNQRLAPSSVEPRGINAAFDEAEGFIVYCGSQGIASHRGLLAKLLGVDKERMHVICPDVGGGFGMKTFMYPDYVLALAAARRLGTPVKWTCDRSEAFLSDTHGRDLASTAELALDGDGKILAYRIKTKANMGAYLSNFAPAIATMAPLQVVPGPYRIPVMSQSVTGVFSNSQPVDAYRGAGRPEAAYLLERLVNQAALDLDLSQDEIRRRNFIAPEEMPYQNAAGATYDSGDFERVMGDAMDKADWSGFEHRREDAARRGRLRGIGMAYYVECTLGDPSEDVDLVFTEDGRLEVAVGTQSNGQGHETAFAQILGDRLGIDPADIAIVQGDTARKPSGGGTGGSRSLQMVGNACVAAADAVAERGKAVMAALYDAAPDDIRFEDGDFQVEGTNKRLSVMALAAEARDAELPEDLADGMNLTAGYTKEASTFPNGCHICELEIDPETGAATLERYTVVDDFGTVINPMLVTGQVHGGVVQGIGQALGEAVRFDEEAQLVSGSFLDYAMPKADDLPFIDFSYREIPCKTNPLGLKGCGEAGTIGACPAVINAVIDALKGRGVTHIDMPATPLAVWQALKEASRTAA